MESLLSSTGNLLLILLDLFLLQCFPLHFIRSCGDYQMVGEGQTVEISSPYQYGPYENCIWRLEAPDGYQLKINITFEGETHYGICGDYIRVLDGSRYASELLSKTCGNITNEPISASARWLWVQFRSDGIGYTSGFRGVVYNTYVGSAISNYSNPIKACKSYEYACANKECMTLSYRCDDFNDCGCQTQCDEWQCEGLTLTHVEHIAVGICIGVATFAAIFVFAFAYESYVKRKSLRADTEAQEKLQKKKKRSRQDKQGGPEV
ncbi:hypothetical protein ACJMK2_028894 [Sinanodonta woodiana]|uniref:CUB domain-containing protein n=1 Tax=Sinanodonta woodiana TaxID=1069815 RepID=A0ABD3X8H1_SINWO